MRTTRIFTPSCEKAEVNYLLNKENRPEKFISKAAKQHISRVFKKYSSVMPKSPVEKNNAFTGASHFKVDLNRRAPQYELDKQKAYLPRNEQKATGKNSTSTQFDLPKPA